MKRLIKKCYHNKNNRDFALLYANKFEETFRTSAIVYINDEIIECNEHWDGVKQFLFNNFNITNENELNQIISNIGEHNIIYNYAMADKIDKTNTISIVGDSNENIDIDTLINNLQLKYPDYNVVELDYDSWYEDYVDWVDNGLNKISKRNFPKNAYNWVKERAEHLMDVASMEESMAYGVAWKQWKNKDKKKNKKSARLIKRR